jgi:hypothetical protein
VSGKFSSFSWLGSLSHLDLQLVGISEVVGGDTESTGSDLLDGRSSRIPLRLELHGVGEWSIGIGSRTGDGNRSLSVFSSLTSVGFTTETVHGDSEGSVGLHGNRTIRHGTSDTSSDDLVPRLDLLDRDGSSISEIEFKKTTKSSPLDGLSRVLGISIVGRLILLSNSILKLSDRDRVVDSHFGSLSVVVFTTLGKTGNLDDISAGPCSFVVLEYVHGKKLEGSSLNSRSGSNETLGNDFFVKTENLE